MSNSTDVAENTPPPFVLSSTVVVNFTNAQLVQIALDTLTANGHEFDESSVKSVFAKTGLKLTVESTEGAPAKKKTTRKKATKKVTKKTPAPAAKDEKPAPTEPKSEPVVKEEEPAVKTEEAPEVAGNNPFPASAAPAKGAKDDSNEATIADVKAEAGVPEEAAFSTETSGIQESDAGEAPAFDFGSIGN